MRKFCAVVLFVFLASLAVAGTAAAYVRHEPDLRPVDAALLGGNVIDGGLRLVVRAVTASSDDDQYIYHYDRANFNPTQVGNLYLVNRDTDPFESIRNGGAAVVSADPFLVYPTHAARASGGWLTDQPNQHIGAYDITSNDYFRLKLQNAALDLYYAFPDSVVAVLSGGTGNVDHNTFNPNGAYDLYGFTIGEPQARNIIGLRGTNPAVAPSALDTSAIAVYVNATEIDAASLSNAVSVPVPLNVTFDVAHGRYIGGQRFNGVAVAPALPDIAADRNMWVVSGDRTDDQGGLIAPFAPALEFADLGTNNPTLEDRQQYWNNRFAGMRAGDIRFFKASVGDGPGEQIEYTRVDRAGDLAQQRFVVTEYNQTTGTDTVLATDDRIEGAGRLYRIVYRDRDGIPGVDLSTAGSNGVIIGSPALIFAENPIIKQPDALGSLPPTSHWRLGYKPTGRTDVGRDGEYNRVARPNDGTQWYNENLYPDYTRELFGIEADALWHTAATIAGYGFDLANVIRFPGTLANVPVGNTAVVLYTLRPGAGFGGSAGLDMLVANGNRVSDLQVINATGNAEMPRNYTLVTATGDLRDGTFAVFEQVVQGNVQRQRICPADEVFTAGKVYFLAVAARDGGDYDVDQGTQGNNVGKNNQCVHFSVFATVGAPAPSIEPTVEPTPEPSEEPTPTPSGSSGGGCSVGFAPAAVLLLAPLFVLLKK